MNVAAAPPQFALLERFDRPGPRYTSYPTAAEFRDGIGAGEYGAALGALGRRGGAIALYVHLPFCAERCTYCACSVVPAKNRERASSGYLRALDGEIALVASAIGRRLPLAQVHLGGGTPTYHTGAELSSLCARIADRFDWSADTQGAVEVDPRVTTPDQLRALAMAGFGRLSVGVQDLDPAVQSAIGRHQSAQQTAAVVDAARALGFTSVNVDLVYGLPHQTPASMRATMETVVALRPDRLAIYSFAWLPRAFHHQASIDPETLPRGAEKVRLLHEAREILLRSGYVDIGIDHFALPDDELAVAQAAGRLRRDFMGYTARSAHEYVGLGATSIGFVAGMYVQNHKRLADYVRSVDAGELPVARGVVLDADDERRAHVIAELLCNFRVSKSAFEARFGTPFDQYFADDLPALASLVEEGLVANTAEALVVLESGRFVARNAALCFDRYRKSAPSDSFSRTL